MLLDLRLNPEAKKAKCTRLEQEKKVVEDRLAERLKNSISLVAMKEALEKRDVELVSAQKEANQKTRAAEAKLKAVEKLEEEN